MSNTESCSSFVAAIWIVAFVAAVIGLWFCDFDGSEARNKSRQKAFNAGVAEYDYSAESNTDAEWVAKEEQ